MNGHFTEETTVKKHQGIGCTSLVIAYRPLIKSITIHFGNHTLMHIWKYILLKHLESITAVKKHERKQQYSPIFCTTGGFDGPLVWFCPIVCNPLPCPSAISNGSLIPWSKLNWNDTAGINAQTIFNKSTFHFLFNFWSYLW